MNNEERVIEGILTGAKRWSAVKARQYSLKLPVGVYTSDLPLCVLLAELPGTEDEIIERIQKAAEMLVRLRADSRVSAALGMSSDATAILALASIPDIDGAAPAVTETVVVPVPVAEPAHVCPPPPPCERCLQRDSEGVAPDRSDTIMGDEDLRRVQQAERGAEPVSAVPSACEHVGSDGKCSACTGDRTVECADCETSIVAASGTACKYDADDCGKIFCQECKDNGINEHGYCEDCAGLTCDGCNEDLDRGTEKKCSRTFCETKHDYCEDCAGRLLNAEGLCPACSQEDENDCGECNATFTDSRLTKCEDEDCGKVYCSDCTGDRLSEHGYCDDCNTLECSRCNKDFPRGAGKDCAGDGCEDVMCPDCAADLLNEDGLCTGCATDDEEGECNGCGEDFIGSRLTACANANDDNDDCDSDFCAKCAPEHLKGGLCSDCRSHAISK